MTRSELEQQLKPLHRDSYHWALHCTNGDEPLAKDLLQDVYVKLLEGSAMFNGDSSFKSWLFSVIRFTAIDHYRKRARSTEKIQQVTEEMTGSQIADPEETHADSGSHSPLNLKKLLNRLSNRQQEVLTLVFYHNLTIEEASGVMEVSLGTARTHYERGKSALKTLITQNQSEKLRQE